MPQVNRRYIAGVAVALSILAAVYLSTLQTIPNGSSHYFMIDVGETQIVLNEWGTLHATGYPLYVILGNLLTDSMVALGISSVTAPALTSLVWGLMALTLIYTLAYHLSRQVWLSAAMTVLFGLTLTMWIHNVIAEIYTFTLLLLVALLLLALWRNPGRHRIYWMALIGGIAVVHHRAIVIAIPALLYAVWPEFRAQRKRLPRLIAISFLLGLLGLTQYAYLYLRAQAGANWVYGQPGTLQGLWDEFIGTEAARFIGPPDSLKALIDNFNLVTGVLVRNLTLPGILLGVFGLIIAANIRQTRRAGMTLILCGGLAYAFHVLWYRDILSALILPITLSLAFGWLFLAQAILRSVRRQRLAQVGIALAAAAGAVVLLSLNFSFIRDLTTDPTGLETVDLLEQAPDDSTVMLAWGPRYFAASIGKLYMGELQHIYLADDKSDLAQIVRDGQLVTPEYTFFNQPLDWWQQKLGQQVYLQAAAPYLVRIATEPDLSATPVQGIAVEHESLTCQTGRVILDVTWATENAPNEDLSVFVKAFDQQGNVIAQGDQFAPVYGWRPLTTWTAGEQVRDIYPLDAAPSQVATVRYGMYRTLPDGGFENVSEYNVPVKCPAKDS